VTILNPASPAVRKKTRDYVRIALGPAFSLIIALGLAFFVDNLDHSIKNISEAEESLGLSVLASCPETNRK
jgi:capsular polysaccharide biosynthesis protein